MQEFRVRYVTRKYDDIIGATVHLHKMRDLRWKKMSRLSLVVAVDILSNCCAIILYVEQWLECQGVTEIRKDGCWARWTWLAT